MKKIKLKMEKIKNKQIIFLKGKINKKNIQTKILIICFKTKKKKLLKNQNRRKLKLLNNLIKNNYICNKWQNNKDKNNFVNNS